MTESIEKMLETLESSGLETFIHSHASSHKAAVLITQELNKKEIQIETLTSLLTKVQNNKSSIINKTESKKIKNELFPLSFFKRLRQLFCSHQTFEVSAISQGVNVYKGKEYLMYECVACKQCIVQWEEVE